MNRNTLTRLQASEERCVELWLQLMPFESTDFNPDTDTCRRVCHAFLENVREFMESSSPVPGHRRFFADLARTHKEVSSGQFIKALTMLIQSYSTVLSETETDMNEMSSALMQLHLFAGHLGSAVIAEKERLSEETIAVLNSEKKKYASIYRETDNIILITGHDGRIIEANPRASEIFGHPIPGRFCGELLNLDAASLPELIAGCPPGQPREVTLRTDDRQRRVFILRILPLDPDIKDSPFMLLLNDITSLADHRQTMEARITERTRAQLRAEKKQRALFNGVGEGILLVDQDKEIVIANAQASEIFGRPVPNLVGCPVFALTDEAGEHELTESFNELLEGERSRRDITGFYVDGRTFPARATITRIDLDGGASWLLIIQDNNDRETLEQRLWAEKHQCEDMSVTLRNVLNSIEKERNDVEHRISDRIANNILPALSKVKREDDPSVRGCYVRLITEHLAHLTSGGDAELDAGLLSLTPTELEVCRLIRSGSSSKEICDAMHLSFETIQTHRKNIRRKLDLRGSKTSLHAYLNGRHHTGVDDQ